MAEWLFANLSRWRAPQAARIERECAIAGTAGHTDRIITFRFSSRGSERLWRVPCAPRARVYRVVTRAEDAIWRQVCHACTVRTHDKVTGWRIREEDTWLGSTPIRRHLKRDLQQQVLNFTQYMRVCKFHTVQTDRHH